MTSKEEILVALKKEREIELSVKGRVSGKVSSRPVWFVLPKDNKSILLVPVNGRKTQWYLNVMKDPNVRVKVGGHSFAGTMEEVDAERLTQVLDLFTTKYGEKDMENYYPRKDVAMELPLPS
jgi:deazaflavin-dependent oxidoreductase (nitroreductase family)